MSGENDSPKSRPGMSLPGQPTEEAVAEVASDAGRSLVRGFANLFDAKLDGWITTKHAKAEAARLAIETDAKITSELALTNARRQHELDEIEHQALLRRRMNRMLHELEKEQLNLEAIQLKAIEFAEQDPDRDEAREIDQDWIFRVADLAQKISDKEVQELWARAISSAAIKGSGPLSPAALQTLSLLDKRNAEDFKNFVMITQRLGFFPFLGAGAALDQSEPQNIDILGLIDVGLIVHQASTDPYRSTDFEIAAGLTSNIGLKLFNDRFVLTKRGAEIANAVFRGQKVKVDHELEQKYLQKLLQREINNNEAVTIILPGQNNPHSTIVLRQRLNQSPGRPPVIDTASARLQQLLNWASSFYSLELRL